MSFFVKSAEPPFASDGGLDAPMRHAEDPYLALDDLMAAVEALCPVWPQRDRAAPGGTMLM